MIRKIDSLLNFQEDKDSPEFAIIEKTINQEFDQILLECLRLDLRGPAIDMLLKIRQKRDSTINRILEQGGYEHVEKELEEYFYGVDWLQFINSGAQRLHLNLEKFLHIGIEPILYKHCQELDYQMLLFMRPQRIREMLSVLDKVENLKD